jgi:nicotinic acid mononucleotide adenylyltransferase
VGRAAFPGSFDPPTVAHRAVAVAALAVPGVDEVCLVLSEEALGKGAGVTSVADRVAVLEAVVVGTPGLTVARTPARLVVEVAEALGADAVVLGADKWAQVQDPAWYGGSDAARDAALARLPRVLLAPRAGVAVEPGPDARPGAGTAPASGPEVIALALDPAHWDVSATRARSGEHHLMLPAARRSGLWA